MKNVVIAGELNYLVGQQDSFLSRATVQVSIAGTTDEMLELHRRDLADLIIVPLDLPGTSIEQVCITIRSDALLRPVQLILIAPNTRSAIEQASRCRPNALVLRPVNAAVLLSRAQQLLDVSARETFRVLINVAVNGSERNTTFFCRSYDISATGMLIETDRILPPGTTLTCSFFLPDSTRIQAAAEVVRTLGRVSREAANRYGVRFLQLGIREREALERFVDQKAAKAFP